ncbi:MAG: hypothetical protein Q9O74_07220 [Planctomycetota bacterium]|nr:hypothetical protein [Planctomycetota bacterium]
MNTLLHWWSLLLMFLALCTAGYVGEITITQPGIISVTIAVTDETGTPVDGLVLTAFGDAEEVVAGITNAMGVVSLSLTEPTEWQTLAVAIGPPMIETMSRDEYRALEVRRVEVLDDTYFIHRYEIPLLDGVAQYNLAITGSDAIRINGRVIAEGGPIRTAVANLGALKWSPSDKSTGHFIVGGVRRGGFARLTLAMGGGQLLFLELSDTETLQDVDVGDIVLLPLESDARLDLDVLNYEDLDRRGRSAARYVSLIPENGSWALSLKIDESGRANVLARVGEDDLSIPAGTYYVSPGPVGPDPVSTRLIQLVRDGVVDLDAAGVPKLTVTAGQITTFQVDAPAAETAIMNAGG